MKLSALTIYILGISLAVIILSFGFFHEFLPNKTEAGYQQKHADDLQTEADKLQQAHKRVEKAVELSESVGAQWRQFAVDRTPSNDVRTGGINLAVNAWQLSVDTRKFRNNVQRAVNKQLVAGHVKVVSGPLVPGPSENELASGLLASYYHFPPLDFPVVIYDLGSVTVQGTYDEIMANVRAWSKMPNYLAVVDGLTLNGTSYQLTGTYNLSIVGYIRGKEIYPAVPEGGGSSTGGGIGAGGFPGMGGMGGGMPGMPFGAGMPGGGGRGRMSAAPAGGGAGKASD